MEATLTQRMEYFRALMRSNVNLSGWELDPALERIFSESNEPELFFEMFRLGKCRDYLQEYLSIGARRPVVLSDGLGLSWIADYEIISGQMCRVHMIGPTYVSEVSRKALEQRLRQFRYPNEIAAAFLDISSQIPIIPLISWIQYGKMLHFSLTQEPIEISEFFYQAEPGTHDPFMEPETVFSKGTVFAAEEMALQMIREGRLDYQKVLGQLGNAGGHRVNSAQSMRKMKNDVISFITLSTRAAIHGGMDIETAYFIGDRYIDSVENCSTISELMRINQAMFEDFVRRVHKARSANTGTAVQACCDYIELHLTEKLDVDKLAEISHYSRQYLTQKFRKEMGVSLHDYIRQRRIGYAQLQLRTSNISIQELGEQLQFCNTSHFIDSFSKAVGCTPSAYRNKVFK